MALKVFRFDASGCNGCDIEILSAVLNPEYDLAGIEVVDSPEKAEAMIVTGGGNEKTAALLKDAHEKLLEPRLVIAMGACAASMCVFKDAYIMRGPVDALIPVNYFVLGCPPRPQNLARAVHALTESGNLHSEPIWLGPEGLRGRMSHDPEKCTACGACVNMCPSGAIDLLEEDGRFRIVFHLWKCSFCGTCQNVCPEEAVKLTSECYLHGQEKMPFQVQGDMPREACAICGKPHLTSIQKKAVLSRILEHDSDMRARQEDVTLSLGICAACKARPPHVSRARKRMFGWVYD
jgi:ech hydrogenase subunit C